MNVAGPLGVSHFLSLSNTEVATYLKVLLPFAFRTDEQTMSVPHGPTITFRLLNYSLTKDVKSLQKNPLSSSVAHFKTSPLVLSLRVLLVGSRTDVIADDEWVRGRWIKEALVAKSYDVQRYVPCFENE